MIMKAMLVRPNVAALCMVSNARALSCMQRVATMMTMTNCRVMQTQSLFFRKCQHSCLAYPSMPCHRSFCVRASTDSGSSAPIDSPLMESMKTKIKEGLNADLVVVKDAYGDGRHVSIDVVASAFEGQSAVNRQRMVYKAIWEELQHTVHAVDQMTTRTPSEASGK